MFVTPCTLFEYSVDRSNKGNG